MLHLIQKVLRASLAPMGLELRYSGVGQFPEATNRDKELVNLFGRYSMASPIRQWTLLRAIKYIEAAGIPGDIVECGVWRGGNMMLAKAALGESERRIWLFDTFAGMSEPTDSDISVGGRNASAVHTAKQRANHNAWAFASLDEVKRNFSRHGLLDDRVIFRKGKVEETLNSESLPDRISILRLDTDWYESTLVELQVLYPRLSSGGFLIIDDYGSWLGSKKAADEYFAESPPFLMPVDRGCRMAIKI